MEKPHIRKRKVVKNLFFEKAEIKSDVEKKTIVIKRIVKFPFVSFLKLIMNGANNEPKAKKVSIIASHLTLSLRMDFTITGISIKTGDTKKFKKAKNIKRLSICGSSFFRYIKPSFKSIKNDFRLFWAVFWDFSISFIAITKAKDKR